MHDPQPIRFTAPQPAPSAKASGAWPAVALASFLSLAAGGTAGFFGHKMKDDAAEYRAYASELDPLLYYRERLHSGKTRGSNETMRLANHTVYKASRDGLNLPRLLALAQPPAKHPPALAALTTRRLIANLAQAEELGIYEGEDNLLALAFGRSPVATRGPYAGERVDVEHIVPRAIAPSLDNILANLMWLPAPLNQSKSDTITPEALEIAEIFHAQGILPEEEFHAVKKAFRPAGP